MKNTVFVCCLLSMVYICDSNVRKKRRWPFDNSDSANHSGIQFFDADQMGSKDQTPIQSANSILCPLRTHSSPNYYYHMGAFGQRFERKCPLNLVFSEPDCSCIFPPNACTGMAESPDGGQFYLQYGAGEWKRMRCAPGTLYNKITCECDRFSQRRFRLKTGMMDDLLQAA